MHDPTTIPLRVDVQRIIDILASQIYQSPLALLRENAQNAFDAIMLRKQIEQDFEPRIDVSISPSEIKVADNGIGMSPQDLEQHFWQTGASTKNTDAARAAGVVGTFGIGAMANFGIADVLTVETESLISGERTQSVARRDALSTTENCISLIPMDPQGSPGTTVIAAIPAQESLDADAAKTYLTRFVAHVNIPVYINGDLVSQTPLSAAITLPSSSWSTEGRYSFAGTSFESDVEISGTEAGDVWVRLTNIAFDGEATPGEMLLVQGISELRTFRNGYGLANTSVGSQYQFGGVADLLLLEPTAGREALSDESMQLLQSIAAALDGIVSEHVASQPASDLNTHFMEWVRRNGRYELCENLRMRVEPDNEMSLGEVRKRTEISAMNYFQGSDSEIINAYSSDDSPLLVAAQRKPRRTCEEQFLRQYCNVVDVADAPSIMELFEETSLTPEQLAIVFRIRAIIESDYFLKAKVGLGRLSHSLPIFVDSPTATITLDPTSPSFSLLGELYRTDYQAFQGLAKDYVRNIVFPRIDDLVPSSTRQGAEAFLKTIRSQRELFVYQESDRDELLSVWSGYISGDLTFEDADAQSRRIARPNVQFVSPSAIRAASEVVPDIVEGDEAFVDETTNAGEPLPSIDRSSIESDARLLTIPESEPALRGFRCFLSLADRAWEDKSDFFLQPHATSIVWGGQRLLFVFQHHSRQFGLYYDVQSDRVIAEGSGGGAFTTCTIVLKNRTYIPVPESVAAAFIPQGGDTVRLEIRSDLLHVVRQTTLT